MSNDKIIATELKKQGIRESDFWRYKLHNPHNCEKLNGQAEISVKVAISAYAKILKRG